jgi:hypothetical protein
MPLLPAGTLTTNTNAMWWLFVGQGQHFDSKVVAQPGQVWYAFM